jgi:hypothetical protein
MKTSYKELVGKISYSPSLLQLLPAQISKYTKQHKVRSAILVLSLILLGLNVYLIIAPVETSVATSDNDLIYGGLIGPERTAKKTLLQVWDNNQNPGGQQESDIQAIFRAFDVDREDIIKSSEKNLCVSGCANTEDLWILGRKTGKPFQSDRLEGFYQTNIDQLYKNTGANYQKSLKIKRELYVLYRSGNIVFKQNNSKALSLSTSIVNDEGKPNREVSNSGKINHRVFVTNKSDQSISGITIKVDLPVGANLEAAYPIDKSSTYERSVEFSVDKLKPGSRPAYFDSILSFNPEDIQDNQICINSEVSAVDAHSKSKTDCYDLEKGSETSNKKGAIFLQPPPTDSEVVPGTELELAISVKNLAKGHGSASPGDSLLYTIDINNQTQKDLNNTFLPELELSDALQYADLSKANGGILADNKLHWPSLDIKAGSHIQKTFELKVKEKTSTAPRSSSDPQDNDCIISINYGAESDQKIDCGAVKSVESSLSNLPFINSVYIMAVLTLVSLASLYYFISSGRIKKELLQIRQSYLFSDNGSRHEG